MQSGTENSARELSVRQSQLASHCRVLGNLSFPLPRHFWFHISQCPGRQLWLLSWTRCSQVLRDKRSPGPALGRSRPGHPSEALPGVCCQGLPGARDHPVPGADPEVHGLPAALREQHSEGASEALPRPGPRGLLESMVLSPSLSPKFCFPQR